MEYVVDSQQSIVEALEHDDVTMLTLANDIELQEKLNVSKSVTFNLNSNTLHVYATEGITVTEGSTQFTGGTISGHADDPLVVSGVKAVGQLGPECELVSEKCAAHVKNRGTLIVDGDIMSGGNQAAVFVEGYGMAKENSTCVLQNGRIISSNQIAVSIAKRGIFEMRGGYVESQVTPPNPDNTSTIYAKGTNSTVHIFDGQVYSKYTPAITIMDGASLHMNGGSVKSDIHHGCVVDVFDAASINMSGGTIRGSECDVIHVHSAEDSDVCSINITDGEVITYATQTCIKEKPTGQNIVISGGKFHGKFNSDYIPEGYHTVVDKDGYTYVISDSTPDVNPDDPDEPDVDPTPDEPDDDPTPQPEPEPIITESAVLVRATPVYGLPNRKFLIDHIIGSITILDRDSVDSVTGDTYLHVKYILSGSGKRATGYMLEKDATRNARN